MRTLILTTLPFFFLCSFGQAKLDKKILINGSASFEGAFIFFPLLNDTVDIDGVNHLLLDTANEKTRLFYCWFKNEKSKIYNLNTDKISNDVIDFEIPDKLFFDSLYKVKVCPLCHKGDLVIAFIYGKPGKELIKLDEEGKVKLAGCILSNTSPKLYCKRDKLEF